MDFKEVVKRDTEELFVIRVAENIERLVESGTSYKDLARTIYICEVKPLLEKNI